MTLPSIPPTLLQFWAIIFCLRLLRRYFCSINHRGSTLSPLAFEDNCTIQSIRNGFSLNFSFSLISMTCDADMARWSSCKGRGHALSASSALWKAWYSLGVMVMLIGNIVMPLVLLTNLWNYYLYASGIATTNTMEGSNNTYADLKSLSAADVNSQTLLAGTGRAHGFISQPRSLTTSTLISPIIPGVNYPFQYAPLLWFTVLFVVVIHECGHAAAAMVENLSIEGFGIFFTFIMPGAYVRIEDGLKFLSPGRQLRVYSAGIWHNVVTALICFWLLLGTPHVLYFLSLEKADGAVVVEIPMSSPFQGSMLVGDVITELEGIRIHSSRDLVWVLSDFVASLKQASSSSDSIDTMNGQEWSTDHGANEVGSFTGSRLNTKAIKQPHKKKEAYQRPHSRMSVGTSELFSSSIARGNTTAISEKMLLFHRPVTTAANAVSTTVTTSMSAWVGGGVCVPISRLKNNNNNSNEGNRPIDVSLQEQGLGCCSSIVTTMDGGNSGGRGGKTTSSSSSSSSLSSLSGQQQVGQAQGPGSSSESTTATCFLDKDLQQQQQKQQSHHHYHKTYEMSELDRDGDKSNSKDNGSGTDGLLEEEGGYIPPPKHTSSLPPFHCLPLTETYQPHTPLQLLSTSICTTAADCHSSSDSSNGGGGSGGGGEEVSEEYRCLHPVTTMPSTLLRIGVNRQGTSRYLLYEGSPWDLLRSASITLGDYQYMGQRQEHKHGPRSGQKHRSMKETREKHPLDTSWPRSHSSSMLRTHTHLGTPIHLEKHHTHLHAAFLQSHSQTKSDVFSSSDTQPHDHVHAHSAHIHNPHTHVHDSNPLHSHKTTNGMAVTDANQASSLSSSSLLHTHSGSTSSHPSIPITMGSSRQTTTSRRRLSASEDMTTTHTQTTKDIHPSHTFKSNGDPSFHRPSSSSFFRRQTPSIHTIHKDTPPNNNINTSWMLQFPENLHFFLWLCIQLSLSVTIANLTPAYSFDGSKAVEQFSRWLPRRLQRLVPLYIWGTTILLVLNVIASLQGNT